MGIDQTRDNRLPLQIDDLSTNGNRYCSLLNRRDAIIGDNNRDVGARLIGEAVKQSRVLEQYCLCHYRPPLNRVSAPLSRLVTGCQGSTTKKNFRIVSEIP